MDADISKEDFLSAVAARSHDAHLRGNYAEADTQYVVTQHPDHYSAADHARWRRLYQRQSDLLIGRACDEFIAALQQMDASNGIPDLARTSAMLTQATGWQIVAVPGLIPDQAFFEHLAHRHFPVTVWLRTEAEFDYIVEPDIFHDFFGHVPMLFNPIFADFMQNYGLGGLKAMHQGALDHLARLYWYTVEFGLINTAQGLRIYGAGILSSAGEIDYCLRAGTAAHHLALDLERACRTLYKIDTYQESYFVINSFQELFAMTAPDFSPLYEKLRNTAPLSPQLVLQDEAELLIERRDSI